MEVSLMSSTHRPTGSLVGAGRDTESRWVGFRRQMFAGQMFQQHLSDVRVVQMHKTRTNVSISLLKSAETWLDGFDLDVLHLCLHRWEAPLLPQLSVS